MLITGEGTDDYILVMFWITIWIQDVFEGLCSPSAFLVLLKITQIMEIFENK